MTRERHNHSLLTNPQNREEETQNTDCQMTLKGNESKATCYLSLSVR